MFRSARHRSPITPRWVRGLLAGAFLAFRRDQQRRMRPRLRLPQHLAAARHGMVVRLADPAVAIAAARRRHQARRARQDPDPRPDPGRVRPGGLPRPAQRGRGLEQGAQVQERLPAVLRNPAQQRPDPDREDRREDRPVQGLSRWPDPASSSTATTSARSITTSSTGRTIRSRSTTSITRSRSSTSTRTTSAAAAGPSRPTSPPL